MANEFIIRKGFKSQEDSQITGSISLSGSFKDQESSSGTAGQVLSSTVSGSQWVDAADSSAITGAGTTGKITKWTTGGSVIGDSIITEAASAITVTGDGTFTGGVTAGGAVRINATTTSGLVIASLSGASNGLKLYNNSSTDNAYIYNHYSGNLEIGTNNATVLTINGTSSTFSGEVTISSETQYLNFKKTSTSDVLSSIISETDAGTGGKLRFLTKRNGDSQVNALVIDDNQNVGIRTTPSTALHLKQPSDNRAGGIYSEISGGGYGLSMFVNSGGYGVIGSNGSLTTDVLTLDLSAGKVGIGTNSPLQALAVSGNAYLGNLANTLNFSGGTNSRFLEIGASGDALLVTHASGYGVGYFGYSASDDRLVIACDNGGGANKIDFIVNAGSTTGGATDNLSGVAPAVRIASNGEVCIGDGNPTSKLDVRGPILTNVNSLSSPVINTAIGDGGSQGLARSIKLLNHYPAVTNGNQLIIPFTSQGNLNSNTILKIWGHSARFNVAAPLGFEATIAVGHLTSLSADSVLSSGGNISSVTTSGSNLLINFTTGYTYATQSGIFVTLEYMTNNPSYSIIVGSITMN